MFEKNEPVVEETVNVVTEESTKKKKEKKVKEPKPKKEKVKKTKVKKEKKGLSFAAIVIPFLLSVALIIGLYVLIGNKTESSVELVPVMYASTNISKNTYIKAEDYGKYFKAENTNAALIPITAITTPGVLPKDGVYVRHDLVANQMALATDLSDTDLVMGRYTGDALKTSIATSSFKSSVSGRIRHGDIINVFAKDPLTNQLTLLAKDIYVEDSYDANGAKCVDDADVAVSFNVWAANEADIEGLNLAVMYGDIQIYKVEQE